MLQAHEALELSKNTPYLKAVENQIKDADREGKRCLTYMVGQEYPEMFILSTLREAGYQAAFRDGWERESWPVGRRKRYLDIAW